MKLPENTKRSFHFTCGKPTDGPIGFCARIIAETEDEALTRLKMFLPAEIPIKLEGADKEEYVEIYINFNGVKAEHIDKVEPPVTRPAGRVKVKMGKSEIGKPVLLSCFVKAIKYGSATDLGTFMMLENPEEGMFAFDYYALADELINRGLLQEEEVATMVCQHIEHHLTEGDVWEGEYFAEDGAVKITYSIEPDAVKTEDGYTFKRQPDGSYSDGDMSWPDWKNFRETCDVDWQIARCCG